MTKNWLSITSTAGSILGGLTSAHKRIDSARRLLAFSLSRIRIQELKDYLEYAPPLPLFALAEAKLFPDRESLLTLIPTGGTVAEVGVYQGEFSRIILQSRSPLEFHLIDIDLSPLDPMPANTVKHQGDSSMILGGFPAAFFDWIYIDGDHDYSGVMKDLVEAHRALKPGGHLMCNDYSNWCSAEAKPYGVARAVNEHVLEHGYTVKGLGLHPAGLHDILLQKPLTMR